jgi:hypothetical protein
MFVTLCYFNAGGGVGGGRSLSFFYCLILSGEENHFVVRLAFFLNPVLELLNNLWGLGTEKE